MSDTKQPDKAPAPTCQHAGRWAYQQIPFSDGHDELIRVLQLERALVNSRFSNEAATIIRLARLVRMPWEPKNGGRARQSMKNHDCGSYARWLSETSGQALADALEVSRRFSKEDVVEIMGIYTSIVPEMQAKLDYIAEYQGTRFSAWIERTAAEAAATPSPSPRR